MPDLPQAGETTVPPISLHLHTLHDFDWTLDRKIAFTQEAGYRGVELVPRGLPTDARTVAEVLDRRGTAPVASHTLVRSLLDEPDKATEIIREPATLLSAAWAAARRCAAPALVSRPPNLSRCAMR